MDGAIVVIDLDRSENTNNDKDTAEVLLIPKGLENKYKRDVES